MSFAQRVIDFNRALNFQKRLPDKIGIMNPFKENADAALASGKFYKKFYNDNFKRRFILGINPGRFGGGVTGVPFTDTKRLSEICNIELNGMRTHEPSSVFIYKVIDAYGGAEKFYKKYYINSVCPLGFVFVNENGRRTNYNYYDDKVLFKIVKSFLVECIRKQIEFGIETEVSYCLGRGKNYFFLNELNKEFKFFKEIIPLDHPRFIIQYRAKKIDEYLDKFLKAFNS